MATRPRRSLVNKVTIQKINDEQEDLTLLTPETNVTEMPYQGFLSNQEYYTRMQMGCFELDNAINELISKRFSGNNLRNMTDEDAIEAYKALEKAKLDRSKTFLEFAKQMSDNDFFNKMAQIEKLKAYGKGKIIDAQPIEENTDTVDSMEDTQDTKKVDRSQQQQILRLLQEATMLRLENGNAD